MNSVNKTLYIPLYGKSHVSKKGIFLEDKKAEEIWAAVQFPLKGKSKSKWLAYYMGIRSAVFDAWTKEQLARLQNAVVIHIGCGMDSRILRINTTDRKWYDIDFPEVIAERKHYYSESSVYKMLAEDIRNTDLLQAIAETESAIVVMEGISMYLTPNELRSLYENLNRHFKQLSVLMDCYTVMAAKASKFKNPINEVGVTNVYGIDDPRLLEVGEFSFVKEHTMIPTKYSDELHGIEKHIFKKIYAGSFSKKLYRLFEYRKP